MEDVDRAGRVDVDQEGLVDVGEPVEDAQLPAGLGLDRDLA